MSIPTPSAIGSRLTQQKQLELQRAEQAATQQTQQKPKRSTGVASKASHSSPTGKGRGTSSKSEQTPRPVKKNSSKRPSKPSTSEKPASAPANGSTEAVRTVVKKPFVRKEHLTQRLSSNEKLREFRDSLPQEPRHPNRKTTSTSSKKK